MPHPREAPLAIEQFVAEELGNSSYVVADLDSGDAAVIDPVRDVEQYVNLVRSRGWNLVCSLDTHIHNDFLSGGAELAAAGFGTYRSPGGHGGPAQTVRHGEEVTLGKLRLQAVHTPGHTPEHLSYLLLDQSRDAHALFSGGALMVGTIARPDLLGADRTFSLAHMAFETVRDVLTPMLDGVDVLPTHGGGSFCGASSSGDRTTSIGRERRENKLFQKTGFMDFLATYANQGEFPTYYAEMAQRNRDGVRLLGVPLAPARQVAADDAEGLRDRGAWLVDVRRHERFDAGYVPGSLNVGLDGPITAWLGWVMPIDDPIVVIAETQNAADQARHKLARIGVDAVQGWMPIEEWSSSGRPLLRMRRGGVADLAGCIAAGERVAVVDVRQEREWVTGHIPGAVHALPPAVGDATRSLPDGTLVAVHCSTGYRSALAVSLLAQDTRISPWHIVDGVDAWKRLGYPVTIPG